MTSTAPYAALTVAGGSGIPAKRGKRKLLRFYLKNVTAYIDWKHTLSFNIIMPVCLCILRVCVCVAPPTRRQTQTIENVTQQKSRQIPLPLSSPTHSPNMEHWREADMGCIRYQRNGNRLKTKNFRISHSQQWLRSGQVLEARNNRFTIERMFSHTQTEQNTYYTCSFMLVYMYVYQYIGTKVKELLSCFLLRQLLPEKNTACHVKDECP